MAGSKTKSKTNAVVFLAGFCLLLAGCTKDPPEVTPKEEPKKIVTGHGGTPVTVATDKNAVQGTILALKNNTLADYPQTSIGQAFDGYRYFDSKEWRETRLNSGKVYIDFIGLKKLGFSDRVDVADVVSRGVAVKFTIFLNGKFFVAMLSKAELKDNGELSLTPLDDKKPILDALFANRELPAFRVR